MTAGLSELGGKERQVRSFGSVVWRVINRPITKWTSYEYSGSILPSWETGMLEWLSTPLGDTQHFRGECGLSAVCRPLPFQAAHFSICIFSMRLHAKQHTHFPLPQRQLGLPFGNGSQNPRLFMQNPMSSTPCKLIWLPFDLNASRAWGLEARVDCLRWALCV